MNSYNSSRVEKNTDRAVSNLENTLQDSTMANYEEKEKEQGTGNSQNERET